MLGGGESGVGAALLAKKQGDDVFLSDGGELKKKYRDVLSHNEIKFEEGKHSEELIFNASEVVKSPGIPDHVPLVKALSERGIPVISEIEYGARYSKARFVAITGSNGKTTTTLLTYHILKAAGVKVGVAGNVGRDSEPRALSFVLQHNVTTLSILHPLSPRDACLPPRLYIFWCLR